MSTQYKGMEALGLLNDFLFAHHATLLIRNKERSEGRAMLHVGLARGNEGVALRDLPVARAFGGELHGKMQSMVGGLSNLLVRSEMPPLVIKAWSALEEKQKEYRAATQPYRQAIALKNKQRQQNGEPPLIYSDLESFLLAASDGDENVARQIDESLQDIRDEASRERSNLFLHTYHEPTLILRMRSSADGVRPKTYVSAKLNNVDGGTSEASNILFNLIIAGMLSHGQMTEIGQPVPLPAIGMREEVVDGLGESLFFQLQRTPGAKPLAKALDQKLYDDITHYLRRLDKRYGAEMAKAQPKIYAEFQHLHAHIDPQYIAALPSAQVAQANVEKPIASHEEALLPKDAAESGCPYHHLWAGRGDGGHSRSS